MTRFGYDDYPADRPVTAVPDPNASLIPASFAEYLLLSAEDKMLLFKQTRKDPPLPTAARDPFDDRDDEDEDREPRDEYNDDEYCRDCGRPSHAIDNGLCPMCFELTGGVGHGRR